MEAHAFSRGDFAELLGLIATNAAYRAPGHTYLMTSDVAWQFPGCAPKDNIRLWRDQAGLGGYAWFQPPDEVRFDVRSDVEDCSTLLTEMLDWGEHRRGEFQPNYPFYIDLESMEEWADVIRQPRYHPLSGNRYLVTSALESDAPRLELLRRNGFEATEHFEPVLICRLSDADIGRAPSRFTFRHVTEVEFEARVAIHAAAWAPASGFNMKRYLEVRAIKEVFDPELDIVAEAPDGTLASYTIAWKDPVSLIGSFEPFGTRPEYRGTGVSQGVIREGFRRLLTKGMKFARIYTAGFNHQAAKLYKSCGFAQIDVNRTFLKQL